MVYVDTLYCCIAPDGFITKGSGADYTTLSASRKGSVEKLLKGVTEPLKYWYRRGWRCKKVEVQIYPED